MEKKHITRIVFDVDGVFTNGQFIYDENGKRFKIFGPHDADGIKLLKTAGIKLEAITADRRGYSITKKRIYDMGLPLSLVGEVERLAYVANLVDSATTCFMGDGHYDAEVFSVAAYSIAPANAVSIAKSRANYVTKSCGGHGAVYEAALHILEIMEHYK
jgi:3-deoxy-D-manno-octulosonate 8-phosphate phosphatase (KDO 8-P phosphatase)